MLPGTLQDFIDQWEQGGDAFERKPLGSQVALLQYQLEKFASDQKIENATLIDVRGCGFEVLLNPPPTGRVGNMHEFRAHGAAIDTARVLGEFAVDLEFGMRNGLQES